MPLRRPVNEREMAIYHVYLKEINVFDAVESWDSDEEYRFLSCGLSSPDLPIDMLYIHGGAEGWRGPDEQEWLTATLLPRLVDENPARIVWCNDPNHL